MALRFYLVPKIGTGAALDPFRAKYVTALGIANYAMDYGLFEPVMLVGADVTAGQHAGLIANGDVTAIPQNLDAQIGAGNLAAVQTALEGLKIPSEWVVASNTYRDVLRITLKIFRFFQRFGARQLRSALSSGITLDTTFSQLTAGQRNALQDVAQSLAIDSSGVTGTTTMRQAFRLVAQQLPPTILAGEIF